MVRQNDAEPLLRTEKHLHLVDFIHAEVILQLAVADRVCCFRETVLIDDSSDDLLDR